MRFLLHGTVTPEASAALIRHEHACHASSELAADAAPETADDRLALFQQLARKQWNLLTTDSALIRDLYERKLAFPGIIVMILQDAEGPQDQGKAVDRLFDRYKRLTPGRMYTITPNRVKIRQLPGGHE